MQSLPEFRLETYFSRWEFEARYHLCASDMETVTLAELVGMADADERARWEGLRLGYVETFGTPALRTAIAETYDRLDAENVLAFAGAEEGLFAAMQVLLDKDDHAVVITPNYQSAETLPASVCDTTGVPLSFDGGWRLDLDRLFASVNARTRLISINFPHNPTGHNIPAEDFLAILDFARHRGIYVFSDEVYRLLERDEADRLPQAADVYERGLSLGVMSKAYGLPGLRVGWIATQDVELLSRMERVKHYLSICNAAPSEFLATIALRNRATIIDRNRAIIRGNLARLTAFFADYGHLFEWTLPSGGCIGFPAYRGPGNVDDFCAGLVRDAGVLLLPASVYRSALGPTPENRFRIGFGRRDMPEALDAMASYLDR